MRTDRLPKHLMIKRANEVQSSKKLLQFIFGFVLWLTLSNILVFNSLANDKILAFIKFKAFGNDKIIVNQKFKLVSGRVENIGGKGENAGHQHFLVFLHYFLKLLFSRGTKSLKSLPHNPDPGKEAS